MSDFDRNIATARAGYRPEVAIDGGSARGYMIRVYNYMMAGSALTGLVAWLTFSQAVVQTGRGPPAYAVRPNNLPRPADVGFCPRATRPGDGAQLRHQPTVGGNGAGAVLRLFRRPRRVAGDDLPGLHASASMQVFFITAATFGAMSSMATRRSVTSPEWARSCPWA